MESGGGGGEEEEDWRGGWGIDGDEETAGGPPNGSRGRRTLRLIFLNGSSEPLGVKLREHGAECVVCWRTPTHDDLARFLAVRFALLAQCERAATESSSHHRSMGYIRASDAAVAAVWSAPTWRSGGRRRQRREEASSQPTPDALAAAALETPVEGQHFSSGVEAQAAKAPSVGPEPVLLCDGAEGIEGGGDVPVAAAARDLCGRPMDVWKEPRVFSAASWARCGMKRVRSCHAHARLSGSARVAEEVGHVVEQELRRPFAALPLWTGSVTRRVVRPTLQKVGEVSL